MALTCLSACLSAVVRSGDYYLFETDSEEEEEEEKKQDKENKTEDLPDKSAFQVRLKVQGQGWLRQTCLEEPVYLSSVCLPRLGNRLQNSDESSQQPKEALEKESF